MWLKGRYCRECGSTLIQWHFRLPHCFVCGANHPDGAEVREWGSVDKLLPAINFQRPRVPVFPAEFTFVGGYAFHTESLVVGGEPKIDARETLRARGFDPRRHSMPVVFGRGAASLGLSQKGSK